MSPSPWAPCPCPSPLACRGRTHSTSEHNDNGLHWAPTIHKIQPAGATCCTMLRLQIELPHTARWPVGWRPVHSDSLQTTCPKQRPGSRSCHAMHAAPAAAACAYAVIGRPPHAPTARLATQPLPTCSWNFGCTGTPFQCDDLQPAARWNVHCIACAHNPQYPKRHTRSDKPLCQERHGPPLRPFREPACFTRSLPTTSPACHAPPAFSAPGSPPPPTRTAPASEHPRHARP